MKSKLSTLSIVIALLSAGNVLNAQNNVAQETTLATNQPILTGMIEPKDAQGAIKAMYEGSLKKFGIVLNGMKMHSINSETAKTYGQLSQYYETKSNLSDPFRLFSNIMIANIDQSEYCLVLMENVVHQKLNISKEQFNAMLDDPSKAPLNKTDMALLEFVIKVMKDSKSSTKADIEKLNRLGFSDKDIYEAIDYVTYKQKLHLMFNILHIQNDY